MSAASGRSTPPSSASPPGLPHRTRLRRQALVPGVGTDTTTRAQVWRRPLPYGRPGPRFYAAPPYAAQRYTAANPQTLYAFARSENHHGFHTVANS